MNIEFEIQVADKIFNEYKRFGYTQSVKNKILMLRSSDNFVNIVRMLGNKDTELLKKIFCENAIKFDYKAIKGFSVEHQMMWALRNGKKNMGSDEKRIFEDCVHSENLDWALYQYMSGFGEVNRDILTPDGSGWGLHLEVKKSPYDESSTARDIIIKEMKLGGDNLDRKLTAQTYFSKKAVTGEFIDIVLENNPSEDILKLLLFCCYQPYEKRVELARAYAKTATNPTAIIGVLNEDTNFRHKEGISEYASSVYERGSEVPNELYRIMFSRDDFFTGKTSNEIYDYTKRYFQNYHLTQFVEASTLETLVNKAVASFDDKMYAKNLLYFILKNEEYRRILLDAIENNLTSSEIVNLVNRYSYDEESLRQALYKRYVYKWRVDEELERRAMSERIMDSLLLDLSQKVKKKENATSPAEA